MVDESVPNEYRDREQAYVKHTVLQKYLIRLLMIVGQSRADTIGFVDGFAGPWKSETDDLTDTSIGISLKQCLKAREKFDELGINPPSFKTLYIEQDSRRFDRLSDYIDDRRAELLKSGIEAEAWQGDFTERLNDIRNWFQTDDFVLFFVDPTGWKEISLQHLEPLLRRRNSEFLINFMFDFVNRAASQDAFEGHMSQMFGELEELDLEGIEEPVEREVALVRAYRRQLNKALPANRRFRSAYVRIKDPKADRAKYHLIYLTRSYKGINVFMGVSEKAEAEIQPAVRGQVKVRMDEEEKGQRSLLTLPTQSARDPRPAVRDLKEVWLDAIDDTPTTFDEEKLADLLESTDAFYSDLQNALKDLIDEGIVENLDASEASMKRRSKNFVNFQNSERLVRTNKEDSDE